MTVPPSYPKVHEHLGKVLNDPSIPLDVSAIEKLKAEITESTDRAVSAALLTRISQLLPVLREDPTPLTTLGIKATAYCSFSDIRSVDPPVNILAGIKARSPPVNLLALSLVGKAGKSPSDAAVVAGDPELVASLVELWLSTSVTEVAQAAFDVLWSLLEVDHTSPLENGDKSSGNKKAAGGQGLMWRRLFTDRKVYGLFFSICSLIDAGQPGKLSKREKTIAQGRLMDLVAKAGKLRWDAVADSHIPDIESRYHCTSLLHFTACQMVDTGDVLMHMTLLNFFRELLQIDAPGLLARNHVRSSSTFSSPALDFLVSQDLHPMIIGYYLNPKKLDAVDLVYVAGPIMAYVAQYALLYPNHLLQKPQDFLDKILAHIVESFAMPSAQWAHGPVPTGDLRILSSLPRVLLVQAGVQSPNPLLALPSSPANKDSLDTLARIFHGPPKCEKVQSLDLNAPGQIPTDWHKEAAAARVLYFTYLNNNPNFWNHIVAAADTIALHEVALAALSLMKAVITANWETLDETVRGPVGSRYQLPSEEELSRLSPAAQGTLPTSGAWAMLSPPALTTVIPYLFKPPQTYANFVGGGANDTESAVWRVATTKYDVLVALYDALHETRLDVEGFDDIMRTLAQRVREGPLGPQIQAGSRVDTMQM
ncbi:hypothetical protein M432DRAFT_286143 [Thermoascus aurantiacus ATCC 26904]